MSIQSLIPKPPCQGSLGIRLNTIVINNLNNQSFRHLKKTISRSPKEKQIIVETLQQSIQEQLVLYGNISGSLSPTRTFSTTSENPSSPSHDNHMMRMLSSFQYHDSIDSEYELTLL